MMTPKEYIKHMQLDVLLDDYSLGDTIWFMENYAKYVAEETAKNLPPIPVTPSNSEVVDKYAILMDIVASDYMKNAEGVINIYDTLEEAQTVCWMYEFEDVLIVKVVENFKDGE